MEAKRPPVSRRALDAAAHFRSRIAAGLSRAVFYPVWDLRDRSEKMREWKRLEASQWQSTDEIERQRFPRLFAILEHARLTAPFYSERNLPAIESLEDLGRWPVVTKDDLRTRPESFRSSAIPLERLITAKTGGSTGTALQVWFDERCQQMRNAAALRANRWSGWELGETVGALWGNPPSATSFKQHVRSRLLDRTVYLDTVTMDDKHMDAFIRTLLRKRVRFLFGHAHSIYVLARFVESHGIAGLDIRGIVSTSMMLLPSERRTIERVFDCRVTNRYGCEEVGLIASECERGNGFHLNADHLVVEILREDGRPADPGEEGDVVVTDLLNFGMPLVRYRVGDVAVATDRSCPCGRGLPMIASLKGRTADFLVKADGSLVAGVSLVERTLTAIPGLAQMQIVQEERGSVRVNVVGDGRYNGETEAALAAELKRVLGEEVRIDIHRAERLQQDRNGKYRFAICRLPNRYQEAAS